MDKASRAVINEIVKQVWSSKCRDCRRIFCSLTAEVREGAVARRGALKEEEIQLSHWLDLLCRQGDLDAHGSHGQLHHQFGLVRKQGAAHSRLAAIARHEQRAGARGAIFEASADDAVVAGVKLAEDFPPLESRRC